MSLLAALSLNVIAQVDQSQKAKLEEIEKVLHRWDDASQAIALGLISAQQWPGSTLCYYPIRPYSSDLGLTDSQIRQLEQLQQAVATKPKRDQALAVLDNSQKSKLAAFETALLLASEAIARGLIPDPPKGEVLCH